ncbi:hypothetical protein JAAARDRAFT_195440 [Jaapia argillacea MUCL 33604]|uniref:Multiple myeloma tumor-associated protein 2-like N-terminal domain-containing protein n=1 Tax=Jaapia argillacea MUCL 33604 TaxID=933084 RepID=A0A067PWE7_9AGAM|nr:hypothetical protein JAAARDRAFT_195440 [Jaapia argillacea MUCL 33604]
MFEPVRGGTRGGQAEFKWSDVSADKDRENYLGHSINAPTGRWQKNKDVHWYNRDKKDDEAERLEEIRKVKEAEAEALSVALGFGPAKKDASGSAMSPTTTSGSPPLTGSNAVVANADIQKAFDKEERRKRKAEKKAKKEKRRAERAVRGVRSDDEDEDRDRYRQHRSRDESPHRSRSRSPVPRARRRNERSRTPIARDRRDRDVERPRDAHSPSGRGGREMVSGDYDIGQRERERERDRRRWEDNNSRRDGGGTRWGRDRS